MKRKLDKELAVRLMTRAAIFLKQAGREEISFQEFMKMHKGKKKFLRDLWLALRRYAAKPIMFMDLEAEVIIYADLKQKRFIIKRIR